MARAKEKAASVLPTWARRLRQARQRLGVTQQALGEMAGMDVSVASPRVNQYERGRREPDVATLTLLAGALGVPVAYLFCEDASVADLLVALHELPARRRTTYVVALLKELAAAD